MAGSLKHTGWIYSRTSNKKEEFVSSLERESPFGLTTRKWATLLETSEQQTISFRLGCPHQATPSGTLRMAVTTHLKCLNCNGRQFHSYWLWTTRWIRKIFVWELFNLQVHCTIAVTIHLSSLKRRWLTHTYGWPKVHWSCARSLPRYSLNIYLLKTYMIHGTAYWESTCLRTGNLNLRNTRWLHPEIVWETTQTPKVKKKKSGPIGSS